MIAPHHASGSVEDGLTYWNFISSNWLLLLLLAFVGCSYGRERKGNVERPSSESIVLNSEKGPVTLQVRLWPKAPRLSDLVELEIEVGSEADVVIRPPAFGEAVGDFLVRDYTERTPKKGTELGKSNRRTFYYQLEPVWCQPSRRTARKVGHFGHGNSRQQEPGRAHQGAR